MTARAHTIYAHTDPTGSMPGYVNLSALGHDDAALTVRTPSVGTTALMHLSRTELDARQARAMFEYCLRVSP